MKKLLFFYLFPLVTIAQSNGVMDDYYNSILDWNLSSAALKTELNTLISTNHVKSISEGFVYAKASNIHMGRTMQIWEVRVTDESSNLISLGKLTTLSFKKNK